jgi:hypothetical protein
MPFSAPGAAAALAAAILTKQNAVITAFKLQGRPDAEQLRRDMIHALAEAINEHILSFGVGAVPGVTPGLGVANVV